MTLTGFLFWLVGIALGWLLCGAITIACIDRLVEALRRIGLIRTESSLFPRKDGVAPFSDNDIIFFFSAGPFLWLLFAVVFCGELSQIVNEKIDLDLKRWLIRFGKWIVEKTNNVNNASQDVRNKEESR